MAKSPSVNNPLQKSAKKAKAWLHANHLHTCICKHQEEVTSRLPWSSVRLSEVHPEKIGKTFRYHDLQACNSLILRAVERGDLCCAFTTYQEMQREGMQTDRYTFPPLIRACAELKHVELGRHMRAEISRRGLENDAIVGTMLISMFSKCGLVAEAFEVFVGLPDRNVVSWNALITCYVENMLYEEAINCYMDMHLKGIAASAVTYTCILKACAAIGAIEKGQKLHTEIVKRGFHREPLVGNSLLDMLVKHGCLLEAQTVFDRLPIQDTVSWNILISGLTEHGFDYKSLEYLQDMKHRGISPDAITISCSLKACASIQALETGREIQTLAKQHGLERDVNVGSALINMFCKCNSMMDAWLVLDAIPLRNVVCWNSFIVGCIEHGHDEEALNCYEQMQFDGLHPDSITYTCSLKACGNLGVLDKGRHIYIDVVLKGIDKEPYMESSLITLFCKGESLLEAWQVLSKSSCCNTFSWNAIITGLLEYGLEKEALECFDLMQSQGLSPDAVTFVSILKACTNLGDMIRGQDIRSQIAKRGLETDLFVGSALVDMFAKFGALEEAREVFDMLPCRNVVLWTALITGFAEHGFGNEALNILDWMKMESVSPDLITYMCILKAYGSINSIEIGQKLHYEIVQKGLDKDPFLGGALVCMFSKCGALYEALEVFNKLSVRDVIAWSALIELYAEQGSGEEALHCFEEMQLDGVQPDVLAFVGSLKACCSIWAIERGWVIFAEVVKRGLDSDTVGNSLIHMFGKFGLLPEAEKIFNKLSNEDSSLRSLLISVYIEHGLMEKALKLFDSMQLDSIPSLAATYISMTKACMDILCIRRCREIRVEISEKGLDKNLVVGNALIDMFCKCGSLGEARQVFEKLSTRDAISWNAMITGYANRGCGQEALELFDKMQHQDGFPDAITLVGCIKACGLVGGLDRGRSMCFEIIRSGWDRDEHVGTSLVDMFGKCHVLEEAKKVFDTLPIVGATTWTALIGAYAEDEFGEVALSCFQDMQSKGFFLDAVTYICGLKACSSLSNLEIGLAIHTKVVKGGFEKDIAVGSALVDMYGECCCLKDARAVLAKLPVQETVSWTALIKGYTINEDIKTALECFENMLEQGVHPDAVTYMCLLAACSHTSLVSKGYEYLKMMIEHKIQPKGDQGASIVDLFARSGLIQEAERFIDMMQDCSSKQTWMALLSACKVYGDIHVGRRCFQELMKIDRGEASAYVFITNLYANADRWEESNRIEGLRMVAGARKKPASALIELQHMSFEFVVGSSQNEDIFYKFKGTVSQMRSNGYVPTSRY